MMNLDRVGRDLDRARAMVKLKHSEMGLINEALYMKGGYVLTLSDKTRGRFFDDEFGIAIYQERYAFNGTSKAKYVRAFIEVEDEFTVCRVLRRIWEHRASLLHYQKA